MQLGLCNFLRKGIIIFKIKKKKKKRINSAFLRTKDRMPYVTEQVLAFEAMTINKILLYGVRP